MRSGYVDVNVGYLRVPGNYGFASSSKALPRYNVDTIAPSMHYLSFDAKGVYPTSVHYRWNGFPLRCKTLSHDRVLQHINRGGLYKNFDTVMEFR